MKIKKNVDERELMEMYKIEHYAFWAIFWLLLASIFIQLIFCGPQFSQIAGEWIVFMIAALGSSIAYFKGGHYDYFTKPCLKSYLLYSLIFACAFDILFALIIYVQHSFYNMIGFIISVIFVWVFLFVVLFVVLSISGEAIKKKREKLEHQLDDKE